MLTATKGTDLTMQRLVLAVLFVTLAVAFVAYVAGRFSRRDDASAAGSAVATGGTMQKVSFFLLLCLMIYVAMNGAS